jgi:hypothetical protein
MIDATQVRNVALDYLSGKLRSKRFLEQFALMSHNIHKCENADAIQLCNRIETLIALSITESLPDSEFRVELAKLLTVIEISDDFRVENPSPIEKERSSSPYEHESIRTVFAS